VTRRVLLTVCALLTIGVAPLAAQEHGAAKAPAKATTQAPAKHGIIRKGDPRPTGAPQPRPAEPVKVAPAASTEAVAAAIAAAVKSVEEKQAATHRRVSQSARAKTAPKRRYAVQWPSTRLQVKWSSPDERVTLSWNEAAPETP